MLISRSNVDAITRAFWRRIHPHRNDHDRELPTEMPVEFTAHMSTALCALDEKFSDLLKAAKNLEKRLPGGYNSRYYHAREELEALRKAIANLEDEK